MIFEILSNVYTNPSCGAEVGPRLRNKVVVACWLHRGALNWWNDDWNGGGGST